MGQRLGRGVLVKSLRVELLIGVNAPELALVDPALPIFILIAAADQAP